MNLSKLVLFPVILLGCGANAGGPGDPSDAGTTPPGDTAGDTPGVPGDAPNVRPHDAGPTADLPAAADVPAVPMDTGVPPGPCVPTVARRGENTDALCSNGIDDDCNGHTDCDDYSCSRNAAVTVCSGGPPPGDVPPVPDVPIVPGSINASGGSMDRLYFAAFGDTRPPSYNDTANYPSSIITSVMTGVEALHVPFAVGTGDYMFASNTSNVGAQLGMYQAAERMYSGYVFHAAGNHECTGTVNFNCATMTATPEAQGFRARLQADFANIYHDFVIHTGLGDAHFILTAPNFWSPAQEAWFNAALDAPGNRYTIVVAHEPPTAIGPPPATATIENAVAARPGRVTLRLYGHTHEFRTIYPNGVVTGNAGAPLATGATYHGFVTVQQRDDGNLQITEHSVDGGGPMGMCSFLLNPAGNLVGPSPRCPR